MILVRTNSALIPAKLLAVASRAEAKLNQLPPADRPAFIKKKAHSHAFERKTYASSRASRIPGSRGVMVIPLKRGSDVMVISRSEPQIRGDDKYLTEPTGSEVCL